MVDDADIPTNRMDDQAALSRRECPQRRRVVYCGRVQGVGFRYTAARLASRFQVSGYVRNMPDGRVELVVEGLPNELDRFLKAVAEAMSRYIESIQTTTAAARGEFGDFHIRYGS
jgi:acylphosphatase